jgi:iron complex outermembrane recepter protein
MRRRVERPWMNEVCWQASGSIAVLLALVTTTAGAQTADESSVSEVVVTARRRAESIQNVPESITALDRSQMEQRQIRTDDDLQLAVPGLTIKSSEGSNQLTYSIRGQTVDLFTGSATAVVSYVNDVQFTSAGATSFFDLESIQVLKGPQGTLFGRNATGGAILYSTAKPENQFGGYLEAQGGNYAYADGTGAINIPIVDDKLAVRFSFDIAHRDGYQQNVVYNTALGELKHEFGRLSVSFRPIENLTNLTVFQYGHSGGNGTSPVAYSIYSRDANGNPPRGPNGSVLNTAASDFFNPATFNNLFGPGAWNRFLAANPGILRAQPNAATTGLPGYLAYYRTQPFWTVGTLSGAEHDQNNYFGTNTTSYVISPDLTLKNILGYVHDWSRDIAGEAGVPYGVIYTENFATGDKGNTYGTEAYSEEFQILGNAVGKDLTYIVGAYYQYTGRYTLYPQFYFNASPLPFGLALNDENRGTDTNYAFYGQGTLAQRRPERRGTSSERYCRHCCSLFTGTKRMPGR